MTENYHWSPANSTDFFPKVLSVEMDRHGKEGWEAYAVNEGQRADDSGWYTVHYKRWVADID